jgi:hypothetical protein
VYQFESDQKKQSSPRTTRRFSRRGRSGNQQNVRKRNTLRLRHIFAGSRITDAALTVSGMTAISVQTDTRPELMLV